jgi:hypothetical protein
VARRKLGPETYDSFSQRVRRYRRTDIVLGAAALNTQLERVKFDMSPSIGLPNFVTPFALGGVVRTALTVGNEHRTRRLRPQDLVELCGYYANLEEPEFGRDPGPDRLRHVFNHLAYEQFGYQMSEMESIGRTLVLLSDHSTGCSGAPTSDDWRTELGVTLEEFMRIGFLMHAAGLDNQGWIDRALLEDEALSAIMAPLNSDHVLDTIDRWFAASLDELRAAGRHSEVSEAEKWSLSPLVAKPVVGLPDGRYVIPWPRLVLDRITPTGLYFIGLDAFGTTFTDALGTMFENYVGSQLALLRDASIRPEIVYDKSTSRSVDYFVVTPEVVVLVEVKAARPIWATRLGAPVGDEDTAKKVGYAFEQIERTATLLREADPAFVSIPADRPLRGLVVTLEPFHLVNSRFYRDVLVQPSIPTTVASSHELEGTIAALLSATDTGIRLHNALTPDGPGKATKLGDAAAGLPNNPNPPLDDAWQRFTKPWSARDE